MNAETKGARKAAFAPKKIMIIADRTPECAVALRFAALRALHTGDRLTLLYVSEPADFQHWMSVEEVMREEARAEAESVLHGLSGEVNRATHLIPELIIREGRKRDQILKEIEENPDIRLLVLGAAVGKEGPGPLVSAIAAGAAGFPIPVTVVPGNMEPADIDALA